MKKIMALIITMLILVSMTGCREVYENSSTRTGTHISVSENSENYDLKESENNIDTNSGYNNYEYEETNNYSTVNSASSHVHSYTSKITKKATCASAGVRTYTCGCGDSYTETILTTAHSWSDATCTEPQKCKNCGKTEGEPLGHGYSSNGECWRCGQMDPSIQASLSKCSLELPALPITLSERSSRGQLYSTVEVTGITYKFENYGNGKVTLTAKFSGTKKYDYRGNGQSDSCKIGWKLYDPSGNVFRTGTLYSPNIAVGESFVNKGEDLIYNFEAAEPGKYKLVISDVNY